MVEKKLPYIHIGTPRTATTMLQNELFAKHSGVYYLGKPFKGMNFDSTSESDSLLPKELILPLHTEDTLGYDPIRTQQLFNASFDRDIARGKTIILSHEAFSNALGADRGVIARRIRDLFGPCNIIITIRNQLTALPSLYRHLSRTGSITVSSFDLWLEEVMISKRLKGHADHGLIRQYRYDELVSLYCEIFPDGHLGVFLYEDLVKNINAFCRDLSNFTCLEYGEMCYLLNCADKINVSPSNERIVKESILRSVESKYSVLRYRYFRDISLRSRFPYIWKLKENLVNHLLNSQNTLSVDSEVEVSDESKNIITEYYFLGNCVVHEKLGIDLLSHGYPM